MKIDEILITYVLPLITVAATVVSAIGIRRGRRRIVYAYCRHGRDDWPDKSTKKTTSWVQIVIWNPSRRAINAADVSPKNPLVITSVTPHTIRKVRLVSTNNEGCGVHVNKLIHERYAVAFDYLDGGDGCVVEVIHVGRSHRNVVLKGSIKGGGPNSVRYYPSGNNEILSSVKRILQHRGTYIALGIVGAVLLVIDSFFPIFFGIQVNSQTHSLRWIPWLRLSTPAMLGIVCLAIFLLAIRPLRIVGLLKNLGMRRRRVRSKKKRDHKAT